MADSRIGIITECVCDLPKSTLNELDISLIYFQIETDSGIFTDTDEITADNVLAYMQDGGIKSKSIRPSSEEYTACFEKALKKYDEIIHISICSGISEAFSSASAAAEMLNASGKKVHVFDSGHLSTGMGFLVMRAGKLAKEGFSSEEILSDLNEYKKRICTSFIAKNADYLYRNGLVSKRVKDICSFLSLHPVLSIKNNRLTVKNIEIGNYTVCSAHYIKSQLKRGAGLDRRQCFVTHAGCSLKFIQRVTADIRSACEFDELTVTNASATVSCNCGPDTFGVIFLKSEK